MAEDVAIALLIWNSFC